MTIKKAFVGIVEFLEANENSKVKTVLDSVREMCSAKSGGAGGASSYVKDADGNVTHIFCWYHKKWEAVNADGSGDENHAEYGAKASSPTGLNTMCKEGSSNWTKQQSVAKKAGATLLAQVGSLEVEPTDIPAHQDAIEAARAAIVPRTDGNGVDTL